MSGFFRWVRRARASRADGLDALIGRDIAENRFRGVSYLSTASTPVFPTTGQAVPPDLLLVNMNFHHRRGTL